MYTEAHAVPRVLPRTTRVEDHLRHGSKRRGIVSSYFKNLPAMHFHPPATTPYLEETLNEQPGSAKQFPSCSACSMCTARLFRSNPRRNSYGSHRESFRPGAKNGFVAGMCHNPYKTVT